MAATAIPTTGSIAISSPSSSSCPRRSRSSLDFSSICRRIGCRSRPPLLRLRAAEASSSEPDPAAPVEVIGIGSRKDALIDFCLSNPIASSRLRFWTVHSRDSQKVQLLQRRQGTEIIIKDVNFPLSLLPCPAVILVASAGLGVDHIAGLELLNSAKSAGGLAVAILLKPFSFEGQRRLEEVGDLVNKLQECSHMYIGGAFEDS